MSKQNHLTPNYSPLAVNFVKGAGVYVYDENNNKYLDALSGVGVLSLGHSHQRVVNTLCSQAQKITHTSNWYQIKPQQQLAAKLSQLSGLDKAFFANSGAEANETAIKISRLFARQKNIQNPIVLTAKNSFHGRTLATLSATGNAKVQNGFDPLVSEFIHIEYNNIAEIEKYQNNPNVVAIMLEPILGESGVIIPADNYLNQVRAICDANNWLMILDEVQTGIGRTGKMFAYEYNNILPDVLTLAKGLGSGMPIGACLAKEEYANLLITGTHGSTFGGNHLVTAVALEVLQTIEDENILQNVQEIGSYLAAKLKNITSPKIKEIRAKGLMIGIEFNTSPTKLLQIALDNKLLINITGNTLRMLPPLILTKDDVDIISEKITKLINKL
jgi:acetylornithine aminotransferase